MSALALSATTASASNIAAATAPSDTGATQGGAPLATSPRGWKERLAPKLGHIAAHGELAPSRTRSSFPWCSAPTLTCRVQREWRGMLFVQYPEVPSSNILPERFRNTACAFVLGFSGASLPSPSCVGGQQGLG